MNRPMSKLEPMCQQYDVDAEWCYTRLFSELVLQLVARKLENVITSLFSSNLKR